MGQAVLHRPAGKLLGQRLQPLWSAERAGIADAKLRVGANLPGMVAGVEVGQRAGHRLAPIRALSEIVVDLLDRVSAAATGRVEQSVQQQARHLKRGETWSA